MGAGISLHFVRAYYGQVESPAVPAALCRRDEQTCMTILRTPYARLLGVPNAVLGLGFYLFTALVAVGTLAGALPVWLVQVNFVAATLTVVLVPYLVWALRARLHTWCGL
ncbi:MAG: vitamin K epoxide reductase family protein [Acidobacteria bacterium]|nr:vitamin K epoxide reductase family protein [Acidobacteriota bacterium]